MLSKGGKELDARSLSKRHAFGIKSDVSGCINWLDDHTLIYPVGRNVVMHNVQSNAQKFFLTSERTDAISAIALSPNKKFIAIAESGEHPQVQIVDTTTRKRRKVLNVSDLGSDRFVALHFSADGRHLVTQGGAPQWNLLYWNWERSKPLAQVQVTRDKGQPAPRDAQLVTHVSINPRDPQHVVVSGNGLFRFYRYVDALLKHVPGGLGRAHTQNFTAHSWISDDRIIVATENADLLLIEDGELRCPLPAAPSDNHAIHAVIPTSRGFVCSGEMGILSVFERSDDKDLYRRVRSVTIDTKSGADDGAKRASVRAFCLTQAEETLAIATSNNQIVGLNFNIDWAKATDVPAFRAICQPFHSGAIVGLDTCIRKPLVVTSSTDRTVRVWNVNDDTVEIIKSFPSEPGAVAFHPSGLHLLVCFSDKVRFMNLYGDTMQEFKTFNVRSVTDVRFSVGGQYFCLVHGNVIHLYNTATCDSAPVAQLRGHSQRIRSVQWAATTPYPTDTRLVSCSLDGVVIDWNLREMRKESDHIDKRFQYHAVASDDKNVWVVGAPASSQTETRWKVKLREIEVGNMHGDAISNDFELPDTYITCLAVAQQHRLLFGGCGDGSVKLMTFPLQGGIHDPPILAHAGAVNKVCISHDESMLFSIGNDGSFFIFDIKEDGRAVKRDAPFAEEILISKADLEEKSSTATHLRQLLEEFKTDLEGEEKRETHQHGTEIKECTENFKLASAANSERFAAAWNSKVEQERNHAQQRREIAEKHRQSCDGLERTKQAELQELDDHSTKLRQTIDEDRERFMGLLQQCDDRYERRLRENEEEFQEKMRSQQQQLRQKQESLAAVRQTQKEIRSQLEMDTDTQIEQTRTTNEEKLKGLVTSYMHMKGERAIMIKALAVLQKETEHRNTEVRALDAMKQNVTKQIRVLSDNIAQLHADIDERDLTIGEKEKKIYELKRRNQDLEKHKFVLDHRIRQLKSQIEPKQMEIAKENEKIKLKDAELEQYQRNNLALRTTIEELKGSITHLQGETKAIQNKLKDLDTYKRRVRADIGELAQLIQDPELLLEGASRLFKTHVSDRGGFRSATLESEVKEEFAAHTAFLAKTVESLKKKVNQDSDRHKQEISSVMGENLNLLREIHDLRKEIRTIRSTYSADTHQQGATSNGTQDTAHRDRFLKEIEANRAEMQRLRDRAQELEDQLRTARQPRPPSSSVGSKLPPIQ